VASHWPFLRNHVAGIGAWTSSSYRRHERRRLISLSVTDHPTAKWIAQQITEAFPWGEAPTHLIRDGDSRYGQLVRRRMAAMDIRYHPTARHSPWQNGHAERRIGSLRRECLDHVVILGEDQCAPQGLCRLLPCATTPRFGQGRAGNSLSPTDWPGRYKTHLGRTSSPVLSDVALLRRERMAFSTRTAFPTLAFELEDQPPCR
jgi:hypothetical protein